MTSKVRCLVVDDSGFYRSILAELLDRTGNVDVVGTAAGGNYALTLAETLKPDFITLDVEMPGMNGIEVLGRLREAHPGMSVVMVSAPTRTSAQTTIEALERGALDFIEKPTKGSASENERQLFHQLKRVARVVETRLILTGKQRLPAGQERLPAIATAAPANVIAIGVSTGGPSALPIALSKLKPGFPTPIVIVQHMPPMFVNVLVESLGRKLQVQVVEAAPGMPLRNGTVYLVPGGKQTRVIRHPVSQRPVFQITDDPPENFCKPSIDYMYRSIASTYGAKALAIIMTGMGRDGVEGLRLLKQEGATVIAQDEASSVVFGMAMEASRAGVVDRLLSLDSIADAISDATADRHA